MVKIQAEDHRNSLVSFKPDPNHPRLQKEHLNICIKEEANIDVYIYIYIYMLYNIVKRKTKYKIHTRNYKNKKHVPRN